MGRTGAGKSSLIGALFRLTPIEGGCIYIDGVDTSTLPLKRLRGAMALIPQVGGFGEWGKREGEGLLAGRGGGGGVVAGRKGGWVAGKTGVFVGRENGGGGYVARRGRAWGWK